MSDHEHTQPHDRLRLTLHGDDARAKWLSVRAHREFCVIAPDDSMAPALRTGDMLTFDTSLSPRDGDFVLVVDLIGQACVREYRGKKAGGFMVRPLNRRYSESTFHARRDRLAVLGILTARAVGARSER